MRFNDVYGKWTAKALTQCEAAELLGMSERTFRRYCRRHECDGASGLDDKRLERVSHNAAPVDEVMSLLTLFETYYPTFTVAHFYDKYQATHGGLRSYSWVKNRLHDGGVIKRNKKRGQHRRKRERAPVVGMRLHQDGSTHEWVPGAHWDLMVTMDDASNEVYSGFFVNEEGTQSSFQGVAEVIESHGLFCSLYTDRGSHYWSMPVEGGKVDKVNLTQFGRAMGQLGIEMIAAYSAQARGRSEQLFRSLQQRLVNELALANITTMGDANRYLREVYWPQHNQRFAVTPTTVSDSAFVPWMTHRTALNDILCVQEQRTVRNDNTVSYRHKRLQIPAQQNRCHYPPLSG